MIEHWSEFAFWHGITTLDPWFQKKWDECDYSIGVDQACPDSDYSCVTVIASVGPQINAFWYIAEGMEILWVDLPHLWPLDMFEWHENETWWLRYARENGIDITKWVPIGGPE